MDKKQYSDEEVHKRVEQLPAEVSALLYSPQMLDIVKRVGEKNQLHIDQIGVLEAETGEVMLGFVHSADYPEALMEGLEIDRVKADAIAQDMQELLFSKIRDAMKKVYEQNTATAPAVVKNPPAVEKSVVMPSSVSIAPATPLVPKPAPAAPMLGADVMLKETTVSLPKPPAAPAPSAPSSPAAPKVEASKPGPYKADPYREPPE